MVLIICY